MPTQMQTVLRMSNYETGNMTVIQGDADVFTQDDRSTRVTVITGPMSPQEGGSRLEFTLLYRVEEMHPDWTTLEFRDTVSLFAETGQKIIGVGPGIKPVFYSQVFAGKNHRFNAASDQVQGTFITFLEVKFDGDGADDTGNARLRASFDVPVTVEVP